jgi:hypothetical protein
LVPHNGEELGEWRLRTGSTGKWKRGRASDARERSRVDLACSVIDERELLPSKGDRAGELRWETLFIEQDESLQSIRCLNEDFSKGGSCAFGKEWQIASLSYLL